MFKKIFIVLMSAFLFLSLGSVAFAQGSESPAKSEIVKLPDCTEREMLRIPIGEAKYVDDGTGKLIKISDLLSFETQEEATEFSETIESELNKSTQFNHATQIAPKSTNGDVLVSKKSTITGSINLRVAYSTSGDNNTGNITYHNAYTTFTGFTPGFDWDESICYSQVKSGKDIYAYTSGVLKYYLVVDGGINYYNQPI
ncbi:MAG TPA: hypothetical protein DHN33_08525 [Eubacteriaceae bacterium]|nr:hypothetical protein [Eubacteriaceae bacterium]